MKRIAQMVMLKDVPGNIENMKIITRNPGQKL